LPLGLIAFFFFMVGFFHTVTPSQAFCANSESCISDLSGEYSTDTTGTFMGQTITSPDNSIAETNPSSVLGDSTGGPKHIYVDLMHQWLQAKEGDTVVLQFPISSGKWHPTPTGDFRIWIKLRYTRMKGGSKALGTFYDLPNVPYTMYFYNDQVPKSEGYGLHGAYWHNNFGHPMSHGCVNISPTNAEALYNWADPQSNGKYTTFATADDPGTPITIFGEPPANEVSYLD
jgi:hypothetical protein